MSKETKSDVKKNVLIVEDSVDFSNLLKFLIEDDGLTGIQFPIDTADIVEWATEHKPVAILMDLALRRKGGMAYIEELKSNADTKNIPIIIISGRDLSQREILEFQMQNIKYLRKGRVEINEIKKEIRESTGVSPEDSKD